MAHWAIKRRNGGIDGNDALLGDPFVSDSWGMWIEVVPASQLAGAVEALRFIADYTFADDHPEGLDAVVMQDLARTTLEGQ